MAGLYRLLYDRDEGGPVRAFECRAPGCGKLCRTRRGIMTHLWKSHRTTLQLEIVNDGESRTRPESAGKHGN